MKKIELSKDKIEILKDLLKKRKSYKNFSRNKEKAYNFTKTVGVKICPYCNINYAYTIEGVLRPDLDHFVSQSQAPGSSLQWDNLIPACSPCNSRLKGAKEFKRETHIHPYYDDFDSIIRIGISLKNANYTDENSFDIVFLEKDSANSDDNKKAESNINDFKLKERYQLHKDEAVKIFRNIHFYNRLKRKEIEKLTGIYGLRNILFSDEYCDINQTSMGKLKKDIIGTYK